MSIILNKKLSDEYQALFASCLTKPEKQAEVKSVADKIVANKSRYQAVSDATKIPWYVVGLVHCLEGSLSFKTHLHNGDPLTAKTVHVPKGRPATGKPPFTWEASAKDALEFDGMTSVTSWNLPTILFKLEGFNGFGYRMRHPEVLTPYLWSYSNHYTKGKFSSDGKFDANLISRQAGAAVLLKEMATRGDITL